MFQFQIGTIGRSGRPFVIKVKHTFQFQIGTIGSSSWEDFRRIQDGFNSRLVRLVANDRSVPTRLDSRFNSRLVRLVVQIDFQTVHIIQFQFQIGTIGSQNHTQYSPSPDCVSIPDWYDW